MRSSLLLAVCLAACYEPAAYPSCVITCDLARACPPDMQCQGETGPFLAPGLCVDELGTACAGDPIAGAAFSPPFQLPGVASSLEEDDPTLTADMLELYMLRAPELLVATRTRTDEPFSMPVPVVELNSPMTELRPCVSGDGLTIFFARRNPVPTHDDIYVSTRASRSDPWNPPEPVPGDINTPGGYELPAWVSPDGSMLVFEAHAEGGQHDLFIARRHGTEYLREAPVFVNLPTSHEGRGGFDETGMIFMFESNRGAASTNLWEAYFDGADWITVPHPELDSTEVDGTPWLSPDGRTLVFSSNRTVISNDNLYMTTR